MGTILIRVDSADHIGMGHLTRCLDLAAYIFKQGLNPVFITKEHTTKSIVYDNGFECIIISKNQSKALKEILFIKSKYKSKIMILDINYCLTNEQSVEYQNYLEALKKMNFYLIMVRFYVYRSLKIIRRH